LIGGLSDGGRIVVFDGSRFGSEVADQLLMPVTSRGWSDVHAVDFDPGMGARTAGLVGKTDHELARSAVVIQK
jgi:hypothetical protein